MANIVRIILTTNFSPWSRYTGGAQRSTHYLACALSRAGHDVTVIFTKAPWERIEPPVLVPYRLRWAAFTDLWSKHSAPLRFLTSMTVAATVRRELHRGPQAATIVHANGEEGALLPRLRSRYDIRIVVTPRYPSVPPAFDAAHPSSLLRNTYLALRHTKYAVLGAALRGADMCAPPSCFGAQLIQRAFALDPSRVQAVHNGVPDEFLDYHWTPQLPDRRPLLFFGRFAPNKGLDTLLEAYERLGTCAPRLRLVGAGPEKRRLKRYIARSRSEDRIEMLGWVDHHEMGRLLEDSSGVVLPSREENFSLAVLATMAVGAPLITTDVGGVREGPEDGKHLQLIPADNVPKLEHALRELITDPKSAAARGASAADLVRRGFTWELAAAQFTKIYGEILGRAPNMPRLT